jgi:exodeoxyribonuclease-3
MNIISWNINGIRAVHKRGDLAQAFSGKLLGISGDPDIVCFQETKAELEQLSDDIVHVPGYTAYFSSSKGRKGYSGVAVYTKLAPLSVRTGIPKFDETDEEGRLLTLEFTDFYLINGYYPNGGQGEHRLEYKRAYYDAFIEYIKKLDKKKPVIWCGDVNTAHTEIDLARPKENEKNTGFLPWERAWVSDVIESGFTDGFRHFHPDQTDAYSYWDQKTRARDRNVGWRIDYFFISTKILPRATDCHMLPGVIGSDHCPVILKIT